MVIDGAYQAGNGLFLPQPFLVAPGTTVRAVLWIESSAPFYFHIVLGSDYGANNFTSSGYYVWARTVPAGPAQWVTLYKDASGGPTLINRGVVYFTPASSQLGIGGAQILAARSTPFVPVPLSPGVGGLPVPAGPGVRTKVPVVPNSPSGGNNQRTTPIVLAQPGSTVTVYMKTQNLGTAYYAHVQIGNDVGPNYLISSDQSYLISRVVPATNSPTYCFGTFSNGGGPAVNSNGYIEYTPALAPAA